MPRYTKEPMAGSVRVAASIKKIQSVDKTWFLFPSLI
jgi:hypothetical protein